MQIVIANKSHISYAEIICNTIEESAKVRGTGIAKRSVEYIVSKLESGNAVVALEDKKFAGFCYIEQWEHGRFIANSGLIVHPDYRNIGLAKKIKQRIFQLSREKYPNAKIFSITTGLAVMKMNYALGYRPVPFSELTQEKTFWDGCKTCKNYDVLTRTDRKMCLCTGMLYDAHTKENTKEKSKEHTHPYNNKVLERLKHIKQLKFLKKKKL